MRTDNNEHKALFSIPTAAHSSALANIKPLPEQRRITGHKQTDAYLWVLEVIRLNEPAHLDAAAAALEKIKISPKEAEERYSRYLLANGGDPFQVAFGTIGMDNPARAIENARKNIRKAADVRATFGSYEVAMEDVEAERLIKSSAKFIDDYDWGWTPEELEAGHIGCGRMFEIEDQRRVMVDGYRDVLPERILSLMLFVNSFTGTGFIAHAMLPAKNSVMNSVTPGIIIQSVTASIIWKN